MKLVKSKRECLYDKKLFLPARAWQVFCSRDCRLKYHQEKKLGSYVEKIMEHEERIARLEKKIGGA